MSRPYLHERQTEYWTSRGIEDFFLDAGFEVVTFPLSQRPERQIPFDFVFLDTGTSKMFGIQYKPLYQNGEDHWPITEHQHKQLQEFSDWGYYGLSEMRDAGDHRVALHQSIFVKVGFPYQETITREDIQGKYYRWGGFFDNLKKCHVGRLVQSRKDVESALRPLARRDIPEVDEDLIDVFVANLPRKRLLHLDGRAKTQRLT